eukprot:Pgem_evm1s13781
MSLEELAIYSHIKRWGVVTHLLTSPHTRLVYGVYPQLKNMTQNEAVEIIFKIIRNMQPLTRPNLDRNIHIPVHLITLRFQCPGTRRADYSNPHTNKASMIGNYPQFGKDVTDAFTNDMEQKLG